VIHPMVLLGSLWVVLAPHSSALPKGPLTLQRVVSNPVGVTSATLAMKFGRFSSVSEYP